MKEFIQIAQITIRNHKILVTILTSINVFLVFTYAAIWPSMQAQTESVNQLMATMPEAFLKAFNVSPTMNGGFESLLISKQFSLILPILLLILANSFATGAIAKEVDRGTILMYLTQPISRVKYLFSRYVIAVALLLIFSFVSIMSAIPFAMIFKIEIQIGHFITFVIGSFLFGWALYAVALLISAYSSDSGRVTFISTMVFLASYLLNVFSQLVDSLYDLRYFSLLYYFGPLENLVDGAILMFPTVIIVATALSFRKFNTRDISVR